MTRRFGEQGRVAVSQAGDRMALVFAAAGQVGDAAPPHCVNPVRRLAASVHGNEA